MDKVRLETAVTEPFLDTVMKKFHFGEEERDAFLAAGREVEAAVRKEAGFWCVPYEGNVRAASGSVGRLTDFERPADCRRAAQEGKTEIALVVLTLGKGVDALQERYTEEGRLSECYMAETIAGELLLKAYRQFNVWMEAQNGVHVARYHFFGACENAVCESGLGAEELSLEAMSACVGALGLIEVRCNQACCLTPKKSVAFLAELTGDAGVRCEGICAGCGRKDCPNRCEKEQEEGRLCWPDFSERALPYGYARILGR